MYTIFLVWLSLQSPKLDPDFPIRTEQGRQAFREELAYALTNTPKANAETRQEFKKKTERLAATLFEKGQKIYKMPNIPLKVQWDLIKADDAAITISDTYTIHLSEILFFYNYNAFLESVIPHEVTHLISYQKWGITNRLHDPSFDGTVRMIAPKYQYVDIDKMPACRLLKRLLAADGYNGSIEVCEPAKRTTP